MKSAIQRALAIEELSYTLDNICADDSKRLGRPVTPSDLSQEQLVSQARYVLSLFTDPGETHVNREALLGAEGPEMRVWANGQVRKLRAFVARFGETEEQGQAEQALPGPRC